MATGIYSVKASFVSSNHAPANAITTFTISPAVPSVTVNAASSSGPGYPTTVSITGVGFDNAAGGQPYLEGVTASLTYQNSSGQTLPTAPTVAGNYTAIASFPGSADYAAAVSQPYAFTFAPAASLPTPTLTVTDGGQYSGLVFAGSYTLAGTVNGTLQGVAASLAYYNASGQLLPGAPNQAGSYVVTATFPGNASYSATTASSAFTVQKARPTVALTDAGGTFTGSAFPGAATVTGVSGGAVATLEGVTPILTYFDSHYNILPIAPSDVGSYLVVAAFPGSVDYLSATSQPVTFSITKPTTSGLATPDVQAVIASGVFTGLPFTASTTVTGLMTGNTPSASLEGVSPTISYQDSNHVTLGSVPIHPGNYIAVALFAGSADYASTSAATPFTISPAIPTISVADPSGPYTGAPVAPSSTAFGVLSGNTRATVTGTTTLTYFDTYNDNLGTSAQAASATMSSFLHSRPAARITSRPPVSRSLSPSARPRRL